MVDTHLRTVSLQAVEAATKKLCTKCLRYEATDEDWKNIAEGDGTHLCWSEGSYCEMFPDNDAVTYESIIVDAVLAALQKEGVLNYRAFAAG